MSDDAVPIQLLRPHLSLAHSTFRAAIVSKFSSTLPQILGKADAVWRHVTVQDAAEPFHVLHMCPMSDDAVPNHLLIGGAPNKCGFLYDDI